MKRHLKYQLKICQKIHLEILEKILQKKGNIQQLLQDIQIIGIFANIAQGVDTICTLPTWLDRPPFPGEKVIVKIYKIVEEKRKIYSSLVKIIGSDASE